MKQTLLLLGILMPIISASAHMVEAVNSIEIGTGVIYYADSTQVTYTICADTVDCTNPSIPQISLEECDSLMV